MKVKLVFDDAKLNETIMSKQMKPNELLPRIGHNIIIHTEDNNVITGEIKDIYFIYNKSNILYQIDIGVDID